MAQYIPKSALVEEINTLLDDEFRCNSYDEATGFQNALTLIKKFIDTLEVKEEFKIGETQISQRKITTEAPGGRVMNTDREYCTARYNGDKPTYCKYRKTCKRYIEYTLLPKKDRGMLWMCEPLACRESGYSHYVPLPKD